MSFLFIESPFRNYGSHSNTTTLKLRLVLFPDASIAAYEDLIPSMTCHKKDRHVLAAAVRSGAEAVVTFNLRDFPAASTEPYGVDVVDPDDLLLDLLDLSPRRVLNELSRQAAANRRLQQSVSPVSAFTRLAVKDRLPIL